MEALILLSIIYLVFDDMIKSFVQFATRKMLRIGTIVGLFLIIVLIIIHFT